MFENGVKIFGFAFSVSISVLDVIYRKPLQFELNRLIRNRLRQTFHPKRSKMFYRSDHELNSFALDNITENRVEFLHIAAAIEFLECSKGTKSVKCF